MPIIRNMAKRQATKIDILVSCAQQASRRRSTTLKLCEEAYRFQGTALISLAPTRPADVHHRTDGRPPDAAAPGIRCSMRSLELWKWEDLSSAPFKFPRAAAALVRGVFKHTSARKRKRTRSTYRPVDEAGSSCSSSCLTRPHHGHSRACRITRRGHIPRGNDRCLESWRTDSRRGG